jgi:hypothetical protein
MSHPDAATIRKPRMDDRPLYDVVLAIWGYPAVLLIIGVAVTAGVTPTRAADAPPLFDDRLQLIADQVPEFGGMFIDEDQKALVINVTARRPRIIADLRHAIREVFPDENLPRRIRLREVAFEFSRLKRWRESALGVHEIEGVVSTDIDEAAGRLLIGVTDEALRGDVARELDAQGIPPEAWEVETTDPPAPASTLGTRHRPLVGGLRIERFDHGACTLGFNAILRTPSGSIVPGFVTNSHCTNRSFEFEGTLFYQPTSPSSANFIGNEEIDLTPFVGGSCPPQCARPGSL